MWKCRTMVKINSLINVELRKSKLLILARIANENSEHRRNANKCSFFKRELFRVAILLCLGIIWAKAISEREGTTPIHRTTHYYITLHQEFLPLDEAIASRAVFVIVSGSDGRTGRRTDGNAVGAS